MKVPLAVITILAAGLLPAPVVAQDASEAPSDPAPTTRYVCVLVSTVGDETFEDAIFNRSYEIVDPATCLDGSPPAATEAESPVRLSGVGDRRSKPFTLQGGDYEIEVRWSGSGCDWRGYDNLYTVSLVSRDSGSSVIDVHDSDYIYDVEGGIYILDSESWDGGECQWRATIRPMEA